MNLLPKTLVSVDLHDHLVQFVELSTFGKKVRLESYNRMPLHGGLIEDGEIKNAAELKSVLSTLFASANPKAAKLKDLVLILPTKLSFIHIFKLPANLSEKDLQQLLPIEAENIIPFSMEDVYWDFTVLEKAKKGAKESIQLVLFAAIQKKAADSYAELFASLGVTPVLFGVQPEALIYALSNQLDATKNNFIIELGALSTNYLFAKGKIIRKYFSSNEGIDSFFHELAEKFHASHDELLAGWEKNKNKPEFAEALQSFIERQYKQARIILAENLDPEMKTVDCICLTGEFSNLPRFYEHAKTTFSGYNVFVGDPKATLLVDDKKFSSNLEKKGGIVPYSIYFTNPIGLALRAFESLKSGVNLLPDALKAHFLYKRFSFLMGALSVLMLMLSFVSTALLLILQQELHYERATLEIEKAGIENTLYGVRYQEVQAALTEFNTEVSALTKIDQSLISVPMTLETLLALVPRGITMTSIDFTDSKLTLVLNGIARNRSELVALQDSLRASDLVKEVNLPLSSFDESDQISFSAEIVLDFSHLPFYASSASIE